MVGDHVGLFHARRGGVARGDGHDGKFEPLRAVHRHDAHGIRSLCGKRPHLFGAVGATLVEGAGDAGHIEAMGRGFLVDHAGELEDVGRLRLTLGALPLESAEPAGIDDDVHEDRPWRCAAQARPGLVEHFEGVSEQGRRVEGRSVAAQEAKRGVLPRGPARRGVDVSGKEKQIVGGHGQKIAREDDEQAFRIVGVGKNVEQMLADEGFFGLEEL